jgi:hypothetical protein
VTSTFLGGVWTASGAIADVETLLAGVTFNPTLDYNSGFSIATSVDDGVAPAITGTKIMTSTAVNDPPVVDNQAFGIDENSANGTVVGTVVASDVDAGDSLTYSITAGNTSGAFAINAITGEITVVNQAAVNFETTSSFALAVDVADLAGLSDTATVTVNLNDLNEAPVASDQAFIVFDDSANGTVVGTVVASDPDAGDSLTYAITAGNTGGAFAIDALSGEITVANTAALDPVVNPSFGVTVEVTDGSGLVDTFSANVSVTTPIIVPEPDDPPEPEVDPPPVVDDPPIVTEDDVDDPTPPELPVQGIQLPDDDTVESDKARATVVALTDETETAHADVAEAERTARNRAQGESEETRHLSVLSSELLSEALDQLQQKMEDDTELAARKSGMIASAAEGTMIATSVGLLSLLVRTGSLLGAALSAMPLWRRVDPLVILALSDEEREKVQKDLRSAKDAEDEKDDGVGRLLDDEDPNRADPPEADDESRTRRPPED